MKGHSFMNKMVSIQTKNLTQIASDDLTHSHPGLEIGITIFFDGLMGLIASQILSKSNIKWALTQLFNKHNGCLLQIKQNKENQQYHWQEGVTVKSAVNAAFSNEPMPLDGSGGWVRIKRTPTYFSIRSLHHLDGASGQLSVQEILSFCMINWSNQRFGRQITNRILSRLLPNIPSTSVQTVSNYIDLQQKTYNSEAYEIFLDQLLSHYSDSQPFQGKQGSHLDSNETILSKFTVPLLELKKIQSNIHLPGSGRRVPFSVLMQLLWLITLSKNKCSTVIRVPFSARKNQPHSKILHYVAAATLYALNMKKTDTLQTLCNRSSRYRKEYFKSIDGLVPGSLIPAETVLNDLVKKFDKLNSKHGQKNTTVNCFSNEISQYNFLPKLTVNPTRGWLKTTPYWGESAAWKSNLYDVKQSLTVTECDNGDLNLIVSAHPSESKKLLDFLLHLIVELALNPHKPLSQIKLSKSNNIKESLNPMPATSIKSYVIGCFLLAFGMGYLITLSNDKRYFL